MKLPEGVELLDQFPYRFVGAMVGLQGEDGTIPVQPVPMGLVAPERGRCGPFPEVHQHLEGLIPGAGELDGFPRRTHHVLPSGFELIHSAVSP